MTDYNELPEDKDLVTIEISVMGHDCSISKDIVFKYGNPPEGLENKIAEMVESIKNINDY